MNILEQIIAVKKAEVAERKALYPTKLLERSVHFEAPVVSLRKYILRRDKSGIIAEIKRRSPSRGVINEFVSVENVSIGYMQAGASALSILTDSHFFGGTSEDLRTARKLNYCPILRKEFILEEYQIIESRALGADAVLLIAAILTPAKIRSLMQLAHMLGMEVVLEVHNRGEIETIGANIDVIGVNNRDLASFRTSIGRSLELAPLLPDGVVRISESGIRDPETALQLRRAGFDGFLIGEQFMRHSRPEEACASFISRFQTLIHAD